MCPNTFTVNLTGEQGKFAPIIGHFCDLAGSTNRFMASVQYLLDACMENEALADTVIDIINATNPESGEECTMITTSHLYRLARGVQSGSVKIACKS